MDKNKMAKLDNVWQVSWLKEDGIHWYTYKAVGSRVIFYYEMTQNEMNLLLSKYYKSRDARISNNVEMVHTIIKSALNCK